jgi:hypothetical protein
VTFIPERRIENLAAELWRRHELEPGFDLEVLFDALGLSLLWCELPTNVLGALNPADRVVMLNELRLDDFKANPGLERFTGGHEVGHWICHGAEAQSGVLPMMPGGRTWCRNGSKEPTEIQADQFASYLLMPTDRLRPLLPQTPWRGWPVVYRLAETFVVSPTAMIVRLDRAQWAHRDENGAPISGRGDAGSSAGQATLPLA